MKFKKLFEAIEIFFQNNDLENQAKKEELRDALDEKIASVREKIKENSSKSKDEKLKKKLAILEELKNKL